MHAELIEQDSSSEVDFCALIRKKLDKVVYYRELVGVVRAFESTLLIAREQQLCELGNDWITGGFIENLNFSSFISAKMSNSIAGPSRR